MNRLKFSRSPWTDARTSPNLSPACSVKPLGENCNCSITRVWVSSRRWKDTTPACSGPSTECQAMRSSGRCSLISASNSRSTPAILVTQWVRVGVSWSILSTPCMKYGKSLNWVHWL